MGKNEDIKARLEDLKGYMFNGIHRLIKDNQELNDTLKEDTIVESSLQRFKPSKHKKAYRIENNFRKRCYTR